MNKKSLPGFADVPLALLTGGIGKRVQGISRTVPKALFQVGGSPFILHQLDLLRRNGIRRLILCTGHLGQQIEAVVGDGTRFGLFVQYSREGERLLGTGGALKQAEPMLGGLFWVMYGDSYLDVNFREVFNAFRDSPALGILTIFRNQNKFDRSNIVFRDGRLIEYNKRVQHAGMAYIDYGLALLRREAMAEVPAGVPYDLGEVYRALIARGALEAFEVCRRFYEVGSPCGLRETRRFFKRTRPLRCRRTIPERVRSVNATVLA